MNPSLVQTVHSSEHGTLAACRRMALAPFLAGMTLLLSSPARADQLSLQTAPPVVVKTVPVAGADDVDPALTELRVTFSKPMQDGSWSWSTWGEEYFPKMTGDPRYLADGRTCVLPVKLQPGKFYASWLNSDKFHNFKDRDGRPAVPYLFTFVTAKGRGDAGIKNGEGGGGGSGADAVLNDDQRLVLAWTDRQFRSFFDRRSYQGWSKAERADLEAKSLDALDGPHNRDYYQAIGTLTALRPRKAIQPLLALATDRADKDCRDRWMAIRALGMIGDKAVVPELIPLVYHGNANTRCWAQISLVRLTGQNFGGDWQAWGKWWNRQDGQPPFTPEIIRWWSGQPEPEKLAESLAASDGKFLQTIREPAPRGQTPAEAEDSAASSSHQQPEK